MANLYVRSTDGSNADNGTTWALAKADLTGAAAIDGVGDVIYISDAHAETTASSLTFALAGTLASPTKIICGDDAAEPPTAISTAGSITTTGTSNIIFSGVSYYVDGLTFNLGTSTGAPYFSLTNTAAASGTFANCNLNILATGAGANFRLAGSFAEAILQNCDIYFSAVGQHIAVDITNGGRVVWNGGTLASGTTSPTALVKLTSGQALLSGVDLTNAGTSMNIFNQSGANGSRAAIRNSKLPASWAGSLVSGTMVLNSRFEMHNCDSGDTNYKMQVTDYAGSILVEDVIKRTGGANDGTTGYSWKLVSTANAEYPHLTLDSPELPALWNATTGSAVTITVHTVTDNVTLTDAECWLEVQYLGTSGFPLGSFVSDAKADVLATAANQTTSSETWTTTGLTTPVKRQLSVTFTPQEAGYIQAVVKFAKASSTVYVCPKMVKS